MTAETSLTLKTDPDWLAAGDQLVANLRAGQTDKDRLSILLDVCAGLGDQLYPAFLKLLCALGRFGDAPAKALVSQTLGTALVRSRLPSGRLAAWGLNASAGRSLGPVEYLCVWYLDRSRTDRLDEETFIDAVGYLTELVKAEPQTLSVYTEKLTQDANASLEGTFSRSARQLLARLAELWAKGADVDDIKRGLRIVLREQKATSVSPHWNI